MKKSEWIAVAEALGHLRASIAASWPPKEGYAANALEIHDRKLIYFARLETIDRVATVLAAALDKFGTTFDYQRFLRIVVGER